MREQADFEVEDFENRNSTKGVYAKFYWKAKQDEAESAKEGRPIFKDVAYVEIIAAGNSNNIVNRPVTELDRRRFAQAWGKFNAGETEQLTGTPLSEIPWITRGQVEELNYIKCRTLEHLSELNDGACNSAPGLYDLKRKAQAWLKKAEDAAPFTALHQENDALKSEIAALKEAVAELANKKKQELTHGNGGAHRYVEGKM